MPLARRARDDGWYTPTARLCTPHGPLFRCTPGTVKAVPGWAVADGIRARMAAFMICYCEMLQRKIN
ncbi:hypothetical protein GIB67_013268 [Kingdonia uniflora]|uniref:Uncharacterized protein n=1 Tax=Kingdonia uniflora TaxID=39325 RepID=A0A7J7N6J8_9MAGN|nr:hypothetical protein GIB67_013268 [Kingdonia uniflora]